MSTAPSSLSTTSGSKHLSMLAPGSAVTLDVLTTSGERARCRTLFVGFLPNQYVLLQFPDTTKFPSVAPLLEPGIGLTVRGLVERYEGAIVAFRTTIKQVIVRPSRLLVLAFPSQSQLQNLRSATRIATQIPVKLTVNNTQVEALIVDLSNTGCRIHMVPNKELALLNGDKLQLQVDETAEQSTSSPPLAATICNTRLGQKSWVLGLMFDDNARAAATELLHQSIISKDDQKSPEAEAS